MKNIFKQFDKTGLVVLVLTFVAVVGFKAAQPMQTELWYPVTIAVDGDVDTPSDQIIGTGSTSAPTGECDTENKKHICSIKLRLATGVSKPATVQEAINMELIDEDELKILDRAHLFEED